MTRSLLPLRGVDSFTVAADIAHALPIISLNTL